MIKAAFFDIDGTLLNFGASDISERVKSALNALKANGVKIFVATGRAPTKVPHFDGVAFDGAICFNGSHCADNDGVIFTNPLDKSAVKTVVANAKAIGLPVLLATASRTGSNFYQKELDDYMKMSKQTCNVIDDYDELLDEDVYQLMIGATADRESALVKNAPTVKAARWWDKAVDIIPSDSGKARGAQKILAHYGLKREEAAAFGDGGNDLDIVEFVGLGVAMGNAVPELKAAADYVTDDCEHDGVYTALKHFALI